MGKQVNFYLTPSDLIGVEAIIASVEPYFILYNRSNSNNPLIINDFTVKDSENDWLFYCLIRQCDILDVKMKEIPSQGYWVIDEFYSPVIEFTKCYFDGVVLNRGRIYFNERYYGEDNSLIQKSEGFKVWANSILHKVRKKLVRKDDFYWGEEASRLSNDSRYQIKD